MINDTPSTGLLSIFGTPILLILLFITVVRLAGAKQKRVGWITQTSRRWLATWSIFGFATAVILAIAALIVNNDYIAGHAQWVWPFCQTLTAFEGKLTLPATIVLLAVAGLMNALLYFLLAGTIALVWHAVARVRRHQSEPRANLGAR